MRERGGTMTSSVRGPDSYYEQTECR
jgi:hypothetical protein